MKNYPLTLSERPQRDTQRRHCIWGSFIHLLLQLLQVFSLWNRRMSPFICVLTAVVSRLSPSSSCILCIWCLLPLNRSFLSSDFTVPYLCWPSMVPLWFLKENVETIGPSILQIVKIQWFFPACWNRPWPNWLDISFLSNILEKVVFNQLHVF